MIFTRDSLSARRRRTPGEYFSLPDNTRPRGHIEPCFRSETLANPERHCWNTPMVTGHNLTAWCLALLGAAAAANPAGDGRSDGIWKAAVPPTPMKGEFDSLDPLGVAAGARIKADCSLNWIDPDDGKRDCFSSGTSLEFFLDGPQANLARARAGWRKMNARKG